MVHLTWRTSIVVLISGFVAVPAQGAPLRIGGFDASRGGSFALVTGDAVNSLRSAISGAFPGVILVESSDLNACFLHSIDVLLISSATASLQAITPLSAPEQAALRAFVEAGGGAVLFADNDSFSGPDSDLANESLIDAFGLDISGTSNDPQPATVTVPAASPVTSGMFGTVSTYTVAWPGWFTASGPSATYHAVLDSNLQPVLAVIAPNALSPGSAGVVLSSDSSMLHDAYFTPSNTALVLNAIAYVDASVTADIDGDGSVTGADLDLFIAVLLGSEVNPVRVHRADLNRDCVANGRDISPFAVAFIGG